MKTKHAPAGAELLPAGIREALKRVMRRARRLIALRGIAATAATALGAFLAAAAVDASLTLCSNWARGLLSAAAYLLTGLAAGWFLIRPLARSLTLDGMARIIELRHPEMQERLSSTVELLTSRDAPELRGSDQLIRALAEQAAVDIGLVRPREAIAFVVIRPVLLAAAALLMLVAALAVWKPRETALLFTRALAPFANLPNLKAADLTVTPGDALVGQGLPLEIAVLTRDRAVTSARLLLTGRDGRETALEMSAEAATNRAGAGFALTLPSVKTGFRYRIRAGAALTRSYSVRAVPPPIIRSMTVVYHPPAYSGLPERKEQDSGGALRGLAETRIELRLELNKRMSAAELKFSGALTTNLPLRLVREGADLAEYAAQFALWPGLAGVMAVECVDQCGLRNPRCERTVKALPDFAPLLKIVNPALLRLRLNAGGRLPLAYLAADDYGLGELSAVVQVDNAPPFTNALALTPVSNRPPRIVEGQTTLAFSDPVFRGARQVRVQLTAADQWPGPGGPHRVITEAIVVTLAENEKSFDEQALAAQAQNVRAELAGIRGDLERARQQSRPLPAKLAGRPQMEEGPRREVEALRDTLSHAEKRLQDLALATREGFFSPLSPKLLAIADDPVGRARQMADQLPLADTAAQRSGMATQTVAAVERSVAALTNTMAGFDDMTRALETAVALREAAQREAALAQRRELETAQSQASATNAAMAAQWEREQRQLAEKFEALAKTLDPAQRAALVREQAAEQAGIAEKLAREQSAAREATLQAAATERVRFATLQELARSQSGLAEEARRFPPVATQAVVMSGAAQDLKENRLTSALAAQLAAAAALSNQAAQVQVAAADTKPPAEQVDARERARLARERAAQAAGAAAASSAEAKRDARQARAGLEQAATAARSAEKKAAPAEMNAAKQEAQRAAGRAAEAQAWADAAAQAAQAAIRAEAQAAQAQEQAGKAPDATARENAAEQGGQMAAQAEAAARRAAAYRAQAQRAATATATAPPEARQAEARRAAAQADKTAERDAASARKAELEAADAARQTAELSRAAAQSKDADAGAAEAAQAARDAARAAERARQAAQTARIAAQQAAAGGDARAAEQRAMEAAEAAQAAQASAEAARGGAARARAAERKLEAARLNDLALRQAGLARQTGEFKRAGEAAANQERVREISRLAGAQQQLAVETSALAAEAQALPAQAAPRAAPAAAAADNAAQQAVQALQTQNLPQARQQALAAEAGLRAAGDELKRAVLQPESGPALQSRERALAQRADALAGQQAGVARELQLLQQAPALPLETEAAHAAALAEAVQALNHDLQTARSLSDSPLAGAAQAETARAADQARRAQNGAQQAARTHGAPEASRQLAEAQQATAQTLEAAGRKLAQLAQLPPNSPAAEVSAAASSLAEAAEKSRAAAQPAATAEQARQAAVAAEAAAQAGMQQARALGGDPAPARADLPDTQAGNGTPAEGALKEVEVSPFQNGLRLRNWLRLSGSQNDNALQGEDDDDPEEYRGLIRGYFEEVSRRGAE